MNNCPNATQMKNLSLQDRRVPLIINCSFIGEQIENRNKGIYSLNKL